VDDERMSIFLSRKSVPVFAAVDRSIDDVDSYGSFSWLLSPVVREEDTMRCRPIDGVERTDVPML
jgi:hypothetical protein